MSSSTSHLPLRLSSPVPSFRSPSGSKNCSRSSTIGDGRANLWRRRPFWSRVRSVKLFTSKRISIGFVQWFVNAGARIPAPEQLDGSILARILLTKRCTYSDYLKRSMQVSRCNDAAARQTTGPTYNSTTSVFGSSSMLRYSPPAALLGTGDTWHARKLGKTWSGCTGKATRCGNSSYSAGFGVDPNPGILYDGTTGKQTRYLSVGNESAYYVGIREAVLGRQPNPVPPEEALAVMAVLERSFEAAAKGQVLTLQLTDQERATFQRSKQNRSG